MIFKYLRLIVTFLATLLLSVSCATSEKIIKYSLLDQAVLEAAENIENRLEPKVKIALLNFSSPSEKFSEYVLEELSEYLVNSGKLVVVERKELDLIRQEEQFQLSGEVSDESAQAIGNKLGAQVIVSGSLSDIGTNYRFRIKTLVVETGAIAAITSSDIDSEEKRIIYLLAGTKPIIEKVTESIEDHLPEGVLYEVIDGRSITIIKYIGSKATINIPASHQGLPITTIMDEAFFGCESLKSVNLPSSLIMIGNSAFSVCTNLESIIIPSSVISIGDSAFKACWKLKSIIIPSSVISIGDDAFENCTSLKNIYIPSSVTLIGRDALNYCLSLTSINVDTRNSVYMSTDGVLFSKDGKTLIKYPAGKRGSYSIPSSVTIIDSVAFAHCGKMTNVIIPWSVTIIGHEAFFWCTSLRDVFIPRSVKIIEDKAFFSCRSLKRITIFRTTRFDDIFNEGVRIIYSD